MTPARRRAALVLAAATTLVLVSGLAAGLAYTVMRDDDRPAAASPPTAPSSRAPTAAVATQGLSTTEQQDALAAAPMASLPAAAANPHPLSATAVTPLTLPAPSGPARGTVATGFPHSTEGAIAQFAAIDEAALNGMNPAQVAQVYSDWALPGAEPLANWSVSQFVDQALGASGIPDGSSQLSATFSVTEAQVKGTVGKDFVLACINGEFDADLAGNSTRVGAADCARMVWSSGRWQIGPGTQPASPPNAWPGTVDAQQAGWRPTIRS